MNKNFKKLKIIRIVALCLVFGLPFLFYAISYNFLGLWNSFGYGLLILIFLLVIYKITGIGKRYAIARDEIIRDSVRAKNTENK